MNRESLESGGGEMLSTETMHRCSYDGPSLLFRLSHVLRISILSYLSTKSVSCLDIAMTNATVRPIWFNTLRLINHDVIEEHESYESIGWLVNRGVSPRTLKVRCAIIDRTFESALLGLNVSSLRHLNF